jgi:DNA-binding MarR family transcriptional regulator
MKESYSDNSPLSSGASATRQRIDPPKGRKWKWLQDSVLEKLLIMEPAVLRVYMALLFYADIYFRDCFPSIETLAKKAKMTRRSVCRALKILEESGFIIREIKAHRNVNTGKRCSNLYILPLYKSDDATEPVQKSDDAGTQNMVTPEPNSIGTVGNQELEGGLIIGSVDCGIVIFLRRKKEIIFSLANRVIPKILPGTREWPWVLVAASLVATKDVAENDFVQATEALRRKIETTPIQLFEGVLKNRCSKIEKDYSELKKIIALPPEWVT